MMVRKTVALGLGTMMILSNGISVYAKENTSVVDVTDTYTESLVNSIDTVSDVVKNTLDSIQIETPAPVEEVSYTYVEQASPVYTYTVTETVSEPVTMSVDEFMAMYGQKEETVSVDAGAMQAAYDAALANYNAALAEYEAASQMIETAKEVEVEVVEETVDEDGNPVTQTKTEIQTVTETSYAGDVAAAQANVDAARAALDAAQAELNTAETAPAVEQTPVVEQVENAVEVEETVTEIVQNATDETGNKCGEELTWKLEDGVVTISGKGHMYDYDNTGPWGRDVKKVVATDGVLSIGKNAFYYCTSLSDIVLADTILSIKDEAFKSCIGLHEVTLPNGLKFIEHGAFANDENLVLTLPNDLEVIGAHAFDSCDSLKEIVMPENVQEVGEYAFHNCKNLEIVMLSPKIDKISHSMFQNCTGLRQFVVNATITAIGDYAFSGCTQLDHVTMWGSVGEIGAFAFERCTNLKTIELKQGLDTIGMCAFASSGLTEITLPDTVTTVKEGAFKQCDNLKTAVIPDSVQELGIEMFLNDTALEKVTLPEGITRIGYDFFRGCTNLTEVNIPSSVTTIGTNAFKYCSNLKSLTLTGKVTEINENAFDGCTNLTLTVDSGSYALEFAKAHSIPYVVHYVANGVSLNRDQFTLMVGEEARLIATVTPQEAANKNVTWSSSNEAVATVVNGEIKAVGEGVALITVTTEENKHTASCKVTVSDTYVLDTKHSLSLDGKIGVNFYFQFADILKYLDHSWIEFTVGEDTETYTILSGEEEGPYLKYTAKVTSAQMTTPIIARVFLSGGEEVYSEAYTVKQYCDYQLADTSIDDKFRTLLESLLNYGGYSQVLFNVDTDDLANKDLENTDVSDVTKETLAAYASVKTGSAQGIKLAGTTLTLDSLTSIKHYFVLEDGHDISEFTIKHGDNVMIPFKSGDMYYVEIDNIRSNELDTMHTVSVGDFTVKYGALSYAYNQLNKTSSKESLKNACRALYKYNVAANEYFGE